MKSGFSSEWVYNFEVANTHTYFVGQQGVLVHNTNPTNPCAQGGDWPARIDLPEGYTPSPALKGDPYHPDIVGVKPPYPVGSRRAFWEKYYGGTMEHKGIYPPPSDLPGFPDTSTVKRKTPVQGGGGLRKRWQDAEGNIYEWDSQHGALEKYDSRGNHQGEFDPQTGQPTKPKDPTRKIKP